MDEEEINRQISMAAWRMYFAKTRERQDEVMAELASLFALLDVMEAMRGKKP